jgi:hypothetical protein
MQAIWKKKEKLSPLGNEASLNFVSLRSHFNSVGRRGLSRVEMNALRAPLTTLYVSAEMEIFFSLDTADAFIDGRLLKNNTLRICPKTDRGTKEGIGAAHRLA